MEVNTDMHTGRQSSYLLWLSQHSNFPMNNLNVVRVCICNAHRGSCSTARAAIVGACGSLRKQGLAGRSRSLRHGFESYVNLLVLVLLLLPEPLNGLSYLLQPPWFSRRYLLELSKTMSKLNLPLLKLLCQVFYQSKAKVINTLTLKLLLQRYIKLLLQKQIKSLKSLVFFLFLVKAALKKNVNT